MRGESLQKKRWHPMPPQTSRTRALSDFLPAAPYPYLFPCRAARRAYLSPATFPALAEADRAAAAAPLARDAAALRHVAAGRGAPVSLPPGRAARVEQAELVGAPVAPLPADEALASQPVARRARVPLRRVAAAARARDVPAPATAAASVRRIGALPAVAPVQHRACRALPLAVA